MEKLNQLAHLNMYLSIWKEYRNIFLQTSTDMNQLPLLDKFLLAGMITEEEKRLYQANNTSPQEIQLNVIDKKIAEFTNKIDDLKSVADFHNNTSR